MVNCEQTKGSGTRFCDLDGIKRNDLVGTKAAWIVWGLPKIMFLAGVFWSAGRVWLWTPALAVAGAACVVNAARCHRLHCYFTGPLYLLGAAASLLRGLGLLPLSWSWIGIALVAGTVLAYLPEWIRGKYLEKAP